MNQADIHQRARERALDAHELRQQGMTYREVGERLGIGAERAKQLATNGSIIANRQPSEMDGLSCRALRLLQNSGITSRAEARNATFATDVNLGPKTIAEVTEWAHHPHPVFASEDARQ